MGTWQAKWFKQEIIIVCIPESLNLQRKERKRKKYEQIDAYLHIDKFEINSFLFHKLIMGSLLTNDPIFKSNYKICISDCR